MASTPDAASNAIRALDIDDFIALASEEVAISSVFPHEIDTFDPYEGEVRVWKA